GSRRKAGHHAVHEPPDADTNCAADAVQGDFLQQQSFNQRTLALVDDTGLSLEGELSATVLAAMGLFAVVHMAIVLELLKFALWTRVSHDHGFLLTSLVSVGDSDQRCHGIVDRALPA